MEVAEANHEARAAIVHSMITGENDMEGTPVTILEAGAAGLPVVRTWHAGIAGVVIHGEAGLLVVEGDTDTMAEHMKSMARESSVAASMGCRPRERASRVAERGPGAA